MLLCGFLLEEKVNDFYSFFQKYYKPIFVMNIPKLYAQALFIVQSAGIDKHVFEKYDISDESVADYKRNGLAYNNQRADGNSSWMKEKYGNTLWYYYHFNSKEK